MLTITTVRSMFIEYSRLNRKFETFCVLVGKENFMITKGKNNNAFKKA